MTELPSLSDNIEENFDMFLAHAIDTGCVWALRGEEGFALCPSVDNEETKSGVPMKLCLFRSKNLLMIGCPVCTVI